MSSRRGCYRKSYIVPHGRGFKYVRAIPKDLQALENKRAWVSCLGAIGRFEAETLAHGLAHEHGRRIAALRALSEQERVAVANAGGFDRWKALQREGARDGNAGRELNGNSVAVTPAHGRGENARTVGAAMPSAAQGEVQGSTQSLLNLVALWEEIRSPRSSIACAKMRLCARRFIELVGDLEPQRVTRAHVMAYRDALEQLPGMSAQNIAEHLSKIHVLFNVALSEGVVVLNPASQVKARKIGSMLAPQRQGFTTDQVRAIFSALKRESSPFAWIVRLLAYHGMRSGEACQLRCEDVTILHGVPVLRVHDRHGSVKNRASVRDIPIHPACAEIITLAQVEAARQRPHASWLFASIPGRGSRRAHWFQSYASSFLRQKVGIADRRYTMHSFRHLWRTLARECEMPESVSRSIMGHTLGGGEHGAYGTAPSLRLRSEWIAKIDPLQY